MNRETKATEGNRMLADSIKRKLDKTIPPSIPPERSIYRVPKKFCDVDRYAFIHILWSIGPFHHGKSSTTFEGHKFRYARELLSQITPIAETTTNMLEECVACVKRIEYEARKCYSEHINLSSDEFVEMMVIDGLFMIELFRKKANISKIIERDDPVFESLHVLRHDLVLLENQLPMTVLNCIFNVLALNEEFNGVSLNILALQFFHQLLPQGEEVVQKSLSGCEGKHLLDLLGKTFHSLPKLGNEKNNSWKSIPSVTKLKRAGVRFVVGSTSGSFLDIKFKDGVMEIPPMVIDYETDTLIRNLIAYEQSSDGKVAYNMTSYGFLMESLINSGEDVRVLRKQGILKHHLSSDEVGAVRFKKFCLKVPIANFNYSELCDQVNSYYETPWHRRVWRILRDSLLACMWSKN